MQVYGVASSSVRVWMYGVGSSSIVYIVAVVYVEFHQLLNVSLNV